MHPILFRIPSPWGEIPIYSYGVMLGLSLIVAWYFIMYVGSKREGLDKELMANCFIVTAIAGIVGSRILYILTNLDDFETPASWFSARTGGLVAYGGFLGGFAGSLAYLRTKRVPILVWSDVVTPALASGLFFTRIGCWLYGCDFGKPLAGDAPGFLKSLGTFPRWDFATDGLACAQEVHGSPAWVQHVRAHDLSDAATASLPVHPTQLYESLAGLVIFGVALLVWRRRKFRGQVTFAVVGLYAIWRFFVEMYRDDPERGFAFGFSTSQLISLALLPVAIAGYVVVQKRFRERGDLVVPESAKAGEKKEAPAAPKKRPAKVKRDR